MAGLGSSNKISPKTRVVSAFGVLAVVVALWFVLFGTASLLTKEKVEASLQQVAAQIADESKESGKDVKLTFGEVEIQGWGYMKHAVVHNLGLEITEKTAVDAKKLVFSSDAVGFSFDQANPERVLLDLVNPVNVTENEQVKNTLSFSSPLRFAYLDSETNGVRSISHEFFLPPQIILSEPVAAGKESAKPLRTIISYSEKPILHFTVSPTQKSRVMDYQFINLALGNDEGNKVNIASLMSHYEEAPNAEGHMLGKYVLSANGVTLRDGEKLSKPYGVNLDFAFDSENSNTGFGSVLPRLTKGDITINDALFSGDEFKVHVAGKLSAAPEDALLYGDATLDIENLPQLLSSEIVSANIREPLVSALTKAVGKDIAGETKLSIPLKREKGGVFYVGQSNFETLVASLFANVLMQNSPQAAEAKPADAVPEAAPAESAAAPAPSVVDATVAPPVVSPATPAAPVAPATPDVKADVAPVTAPKP